MSDNVHPLRPRSEGSRPQAPHSLTPAELRALLDWMGLTRNWFAERVGVQERTVIRWADGKARIPERAAVELVKLWNQAAEAIGKIVSGGVDAAVDGVVHLRTFRVDSEYHKTMGSEEFPASWHWALTCRAMDHLLMRTKYQVTIDFWEES